MIDFDYDIIFYPGVLLFSFTFTDSHNSQSLTCTNSFSVCFFFHFIKKISNEYKYPLDIHGWQLTFAKTI